MARVYELLLQEDLNRGVDAAVKTNPGGGSITGTQIGIHSFAIGSVSVSATWEPGTVAAGSKVSTTVTVPGAALGDFVLVSFSLDLQETQLTASVTSTNTVEAVLSNLTNLAVVLASGTLRALVLKSK